MKKALALILTLVLILSASSIALAEEASYEGRSISIAWDTCELDAAFQAEIDAFCEKYGCEVEVELIASDATNPYNIRAVNGTLPDVMRQSVGAQLEDLVAIDALLPITDQPFVANIADAYIEASRAADGELYAVPNTTSNVAGVFYNKVVFEKLGLEIPTTWAEFLDTCKWIRENTDMDPVSNPYDNTAGRQITYLAQYYYVQAEDKDFADKYTANEIALADSPALMRGLAKVYDMWELGYQNEDPLSTSLEDSAIALCEGTAAFIICRTNVMANIEIVAPECYNDIGFFPLPDLDADARGVAVWMPTGWVVSANCEDVELAMLFLEFMSTSEATDAYCTEQTPTGAFMLNGIELPETVSTAVREAQSWLDIAATPVMEYFCPIKGANLPVILSMVDTGDLNEEEGIEQIEADFRLYAEQNEIWK